MGEAVMERAAGAAALRGARRRAERPAGAPQWGGHNRLVTPEMLERARFLIEQEGKTWAEVAGKLGVKVETLRKAARRLEDPILVPAATLERMAEELRRERAWRAGRQQAQREALAARLLEASRLMRWSTYALADFVGETPRVVQTWHEATVAAPEEVVAWVERQAASLAADPPPGRGEGWLRPPAVVHRVWRGRSDVEAEAPKSMVATALGVLRWSVRAFAELLDEPFHRVHGWWLGREEPSAELRAWLARRVAALVEDPPPGGIRKWRDELAAVAEAVRTWSRQGGAAPGVRARHGGVGDGAA